MDLGLTSMFDPVNLPYLRHTVVIEAGAGAAVVILDVIRRRWRRARRQAPDYAESRTMTYPGGWVGRRARARGGAGGLAPVGSGGPAGLASWNRCWAPGARVTERAPASGPLVVEDGHQHLVIPAPVVQHRLAEAALLDEPGLLIGTDPGGIERGHAELDAVQAHLAEPVTDDDAHRIRAVAMADVLTAEGDPSVAHRSLGRAPHIPMLPTSTGGSSSVSMAKPRSSLSFALHFAMCSFAAASDGGPPSSTAWPCARIHLPLREHRQVVVPHAAQPHPLPDQDRVAVPECARNIGEFGHGADTAACLALPGGAHPALAEGADPDWTLP